MATTKAHKKGRGRRSTVSRSSAKSGNLSYTDRRPNPFRDDWEAFTESVSSQIQQSINQGTKIAPYYAPTAVLKRLVYQFTLENRKKTADIHIETAIDKFRQEKENQKRPSDRRILRGSRKGFSQNRFYWILQGLACIVRIGNFEIRKSDISRFSLQLSYAERHGVPPEYLVGFLHQCGTLSAVCEKAKKPGRFEEWYDPEVHGGRDAAA